MHKRFVVPPDIERLASAGSRREVAGPGEDAGELTCASSRSFARSQEAYCRRVGETAAVCSSLLAPADLAGAVSPAAEAFPLAPGLRAKHESPRESDRERKPRACAGPHPPPSLPRDVLGGQDLAGAKFQQEIYTAERTSNLRARLLGRSRAEVAASGDAEGLCVFDNTAKFLAFLRAVFGFDGIDGRGSAVRSTVKFGTAYGNAFFDGQQMVYGEGDGRVFNGFACDFTVVAHELAHGFSGGLRYLEYRGEAGALNESYSDVVACVAAQWAAGAPARRGPWDIGAKIMAKPHVLRSMAKPGSAHRGHPVIGTDKQVGHMRDFYSGPHDDGGVHINSGIPNRAFYLFATGLGGKAWEAPMRVWFLVLRERMIGATCTFAEFAAASVAVASRREFAPGVARALRAAWAEVGVAC